MPREWNAVAYDALPLPHVRWGRRTIDRLGLTGSETVLDAGCGTGRDAAELLKRLPSGKVVAVDGSVQMLDRLRDRLSPADLQKVHIVLADLEKPLPLEHPVDAIMSVAAFHWIKDHDALFHTLAAVIRPGGRMSTDCGGLGNIEAVTVAIDQVLGRAPSAWQFAGVDDTRKRLAASGFTDLDVQLNRDPIRLKDHDELRAYLRTVVLGAELDKLGPEEHDEFVNAVADRLPEPLVEYVRLEITATRA
jgi:trans-aconitate 2-methyltransferase